ncbi:YeeE/YedE family protein [Rhizobium sp. FKY42]|uniref:YeeE/YedE family protein n=1 Tax=Rhizobium sp. FKY42 TaxID=2562310 RepID=UPI0010C0E0A0|nr:YeeE/YedE family protein [Rhizobium sp. FKY42]
MNARIIVAGVAGILFGIGLVLSDMINPARVLAFLDVAGDWDPSLAFVMGGALIPSAIAYRIKARLQAPVFDISFHVPENRKLDRKLIAGSALFGLGWGLVGLCPGPAFAGLVFGRWEIVLFVAAMIGGMGIHRLFQNRFA